MSAIPLDASAFSGDFGAFETPWPSSSGSRFPPAPGAAPFTQGPAPSAPGAPPLMMTARAAPAPTEAPTAVDASQSWPAPPIAAYGEPVPAGPQSVLPEVPPENGHSLGLAFVLLGLGTFLGTKYVGGVYGGVAGAIYGGAAGNLVRSARLVTRGNPTADHEAMVSATYGVIGLGLGSYVAWKAKHPSKAHA